MRWLVGRSVPLYQTSSNFSRATMLTFGLIPLEKVWTLLSAQLCVNWYNYCFSTRRDFTLNNPWRLICHSTKKLKQRKCLQNVGFIRVKVTNKISLSLSLLFLFWPQINRWVRMRGDCFNDADEKATSHRWPHFFPAERLYIWHCLLRTAILFICLFLFLFFSHVLFFFHSKKTPSVSSTVSYCFH